MASDKQTAEEAALLASLLCPVCGKSDCDHSDDEKEDAQRRRDSGQAPLVIASDAAQQQRRADKARRGQNRATEDLRQLMADERFRRFMWALFTRCGLYRSSFAGAADAFGMAFKEGERNIGLAYLNDTLQHTTDDYLRMVAENGKGTAP